MSDKNLNNLPRSPFDELDLFDADNSLIIDKLEQISNGIHALHRLENPTFSEVPHLVDLSRSLMIPELQVAIVALVTLSNPDCDSVNEKFIVKSLMPFCQGRRAPVQQALQNLISERLIHRDLESDLELQLSQRFKAAINKGDVEAIRMMKPYGLLPFLKNFMEVVLQERHYSPFGMPHFRSVVQQLHLARNENLACLKYVDAHLLKRGTAEIGMMLFIAVLAKRVIEDETVCVTEFFEAIDKPHWETKAFHRAELHSEQWPPLAMGYFEIIGHHSVDANMEIGLTEEGIQQLLQELSPEVLESLLDAKQITVPHRAPEKIIPQALQYDDDIKAQLRPIHKLLNPSIRTRINKQLNQGQQGVCVLLYGYPGTGKTQFCLQLAREYNMPVMEVNVAQIQSKWVGDSEKNARKIFRQYEKLCKQAKRECMLLFNEADALFSKRIEVTQSVDNMHNAMKNIFLEEMENFQGFLMATTNLTGNLDSAFERRFLFKVGFDRPSEGMTTKIWRQYFRGINLEDAMRLAKKYPFSPGEISNVQRKYIIEKALGSTKNRITLIEEIAQNEKIETHRVSGLKTVGFG
jgi:hypothetical protein